MSLAPIIGAGGSGGGNSPLGSGTSGQSPLGANDPDEVARRAKMLLRALPVLGDEQDTLISLASSEMSDADLLNNATGAISASSWQAEANRLGHLSIAEQRGSWANLSESAQAGLQTAGYAPPSDEPAHHESGGLGGLIGGAITGATKVLTSGPIGGALHVMTNVGDMPMHAWRAASDLTGSNQRDLGDYLRTALNFSIMTGQAAGPGTPFLQAVQAAHYGPRRMQEAMEETGTGQRYYTHHARNEAMDRLSSLDLDTPTVGNDERARLRVVSDIVAGRNLEQIAGEFGKPGTDAYRGAYDDLTKLQGQNPFKESIRVIDQGQVSPGRSFAAGLGLTPNGKNSKYYTVVSAASDAAFQMSYDPTNVIAPVAKGFELGRYGLRAGEGMARISKIASRSASVRNAASTIARHVNEGTWSDLVVRHPAVKPFLSQLQTDRHLIHNGNDFIKWYGDQQILTGLLAGDARSWRLGEVTMPHFGITERAKGVVRARAATINTAVAEFGTQARKEVETALVPGAKFSNRFHLGAWWVPGGKVMTNPITWPSQMLQAAAIKVPKSRVLHLSGSEFPTELRQFIDMGVFTDIPRNVRDQFYDTVMHAATPDTRLGAFKTMLDDFFGYLPEDDGVDAFHKRFVENIDQHFGEGGEIPGLPGKYGFLPDGHMANAIAIPDAKEFMRMADGAGLWRHTTGRLNNGMADALMSNVWKPSVLLRIGFIPRAAGEEIFNQIVRDPFGQLSIRALQSGAQDTDKSLADTASYAIGRHVTPDVLQLELDKLGPELLRGTRRTLDYDAFEHAVKTSTVAPTLRDLAFHTSRTMLPGSDVPAVGRDILRRYWERQAHAPQSLAKPFQLVAGAMGGVARPVKTDLKRYVAEELALGRDLPKAQSIARRRLERDRRAWSFFDRGATMAHNLMNTAPGFTVDGFDTLARSAMYHASQGYRSVLRTILNPEDVKRVRLLMHDEGFQGSFSRYISERSQGIIPSSERAGLTLERRDGDRTIPVQVDTEGSTWEQQQLKGAMNSLAPHSYHEAMRLFVHDGVIGAPMAEVGARYFGPDTAAEYLDRSLPGHLPGATELARLKAEDDLPGYLRVWHEQIASSIERLPADARDAVRYALATNEVEDMKIADEVIRGSFREKGKQAAETATTAARKAGEHPVVARAIGAEAQADVEDEALLHAFLTQHLQALTPRAQNMTGHFINERLSTGTMPEMLTTRDELRRGLETAAGNGVRDPENRAKVEQMVIHGRDKFTGAPVANAVPADKARIYVPIVDRKALSDALASGRLQLSDLPPEMQGVARIGAGEREYATNVFAGNRSEGGGALNFLNQWESTGSSWTPVAAYGTSDPHTAQRISRDINAKLGVADMPDGSYGFVDVPRNWTTAPFNRHDQDISKLSYPGATHPGDGAVHYRLEPSVLSQTEPMPEHMPIQNINGDMVPGSSQEAIDDSHARHAANMWMDTFMSPTRDEVVSEALIPHLRDYRDPMFTYGGAPQQRASTANIFKIPNQDLPATVFGPKYNIIDDEHGYARLVRTGFDHIGQSIDYLARKPYFMREVLKAMRVNEPYAAELLDPLYWGQRTTNVYKRKGVLPLPDTPEMQRLTPAIRSTVEDDRMVVGALHLADPSPELTRYLQTEGGFPDFQRFVVPGTKPDINPLTGDVTWQVSNFNGPVLDRYMDANLPGLRAELEHLSETAPTDKLQQEAAVIADSLRDANKVDAPAGLVDGASHYVLDPPHLDSFNALDTVHSIDGEGLLHPIARSTADLRFNTLMQARLPSDGTTALFVKVGRDTFGPGPNGRLLSPQEILDHLRQPDGAAQFQRALHVHAVNNPADAIDAKYLRNTVRDTVAEAEKVGDPESLIEAWQLLPHELRSERLPFERFQTDPRTPEWAKTLKPQDLPILRAATENAAAVNKHLLDVSIDRGIHEVTPFIDNHHVRSQFQEYARNLVPFYFAEEAFLRRWVKTAFNISSPTAAMQSVANIRRGQLLMHGMRGAGIVKTDDNGNPVLVYPGSPAMIAALSWVVGGNPISKTLFGRDIGTPVASLMTGNINYAVSGNFQGLSIPSPSPFVTLPLEYMGNHFPEIKPVKEALIGQQATASGRTVAAGLVPASVRRFYEALSGSPDSNGKLAAAMNEIVLYKMAHGQGPAEGASPLEQEAWLDQVRQQARIQLIVKAAVGFAAPAAPTADIVGTDAWAMNANLGQTLKGSDLHPELNRLTQALGYEAGVQRFLELYPDATPHDAFNSNSAWLIGQSDRTSRAPLPTTEAAAKFYEDNQDWLKQLPLAGGWLFPARNVQDKQSQKAYYQQLASEMRIRKAPEEFLKDLYVSGASGVYYDSQDSYYAVRNQLLQDDSPDAKDRRDQLDASWQIWKEAYQAQHPTFAASILGGKDQTDREGIVSQMKLALADPSRPEIEAAPQLEDVLTSWESYQSTIGSLANDRRKAQTEARRRVHFGFADWLNQYADLHPEVEPFIRSVIRPLAEQMGMPRGTGVQ